MTNAGPIYSPGLEHLKQLDELRVQQKVEIFEAVTGFETANQYMITNSKGQQVYYAKEESDWFTRQFCGPQRSFEMRVLDNNHQTVMLFKRPLRCDFPLCPCCLMEIEITTPHGRPIGYVRQDWAFWQPKFTIYMENGVAPVLKVKGPCCTCRCCADVEFQVLDLYGATKVGTIAKQFSGWAKEVLTDADNFYVKFPMDLDVNVKACLLGCLMLIDFMYFESSN